MAMYPVEKILGVLVMSIKMLNDNSGILGVLVAVAAAFIAYKQLWAWREEATGKIKYQVALNYRRTLLQLQDEIRDLRHPTTRPDESIIHSDEKHEPLPDAGSPKEEWEAYRRREGMNSRVNRLSRKSKLFNFRWTKVMAKYRVFQENLLEAQVHGISDDRSSHELDEFLNRVYYLFKLWLLDQQDKPEGLSLRHELERKNLLPLEGWTAEKSDIMALDKLDADLKVLIEKLDHTAYLHMLDRSTRSRLAKRKWHM